MLLIFHWRCSKLCLSLWKP